MKGLRGAVVPDEPVIRPHQEMKPPVREFLGHDLPAEPIVITTSGLNPGPDQGPALVRRLIPPTPRQQEGGQAGDDPDWRGPDPARHSPSSPSRPAWASRSTTESMASSAPTRPSR